MYIEKPEKDRLGNLEFYKNGFKGHNSFSKAGGAHDTCRITSNFFGKNS